MSHLTIQSIEARLLSDHPKKPAHVVLFLLGVAATLAACSGSGGDDDDSFSWSKTVTSTIRGCTGNYNCTLYGPPFNGSGPDDYQAEFDGKLLRKGGTCVWQSSHDATDTLDLSQATVQGTTFRFNDRDQYDGSSGGDGYLFCWPPSATCSGSALSCSAVGVGPCSYQDGCDQDLHSLLSLSDDACEGVATHCSALSEEYDCYKQRGCTWQ